MAAKKPRKKKRAAEAKPKKIGRPAIYTEELASQVCQLIAGGLSLADVSRLNGMPSRDTVRKWVIENDAFANEYARAREERAELVADECITIADTELDSNRARVRIDARKWWAAKVAPKNYGDKSEVNVNANHQHHHTAEPLSETAHWLAKLLGAGTDSEAPQPLSNGSVLPAEVRVRPEGH